jgi:hypothetical protein
MRWAPPVIGPLYDRYRRNLVACARLQDRPVSTLRSWQSDAAYPKKDRPKTTDQPRTPDDPAIRQTARMAVLGA